MFVTLGVVDKGWGGNFMRYALRIRFISARVIIANVQQSAWLLLRIKRSWLAACRSCLQDLFVYLKISAAPFRVIAEFPESFFMRIVYCMFSVSAWLSFSFKGDCLSSKGKPTLHLFPLAFVFGWGQSSKNYSRLDLLLQSLIPWSQIMYFCAQCLWAKGAKLCSLFSAANVDTYESRVWLKGLFAYLNASIILLTNPNLISCLVPTERPLQ